MAKKKKKPFLSPRQEKYKYNRVVLGMNQYNAAKAAGYSENTAKVACRIEARSSVKVSLADAFEQAGFTDKALVTHILAGMKAMKIQSCDIYVTQEKDGKMKFNDSKDFIEVEDWNARHKYAELFCELTKKISNQPVIDQSQHSHLTFVLEKEEHGPEDRISVDKETKLSLALTD